MIKEKFLDDVMVRLEESGFGSMELDIIKGAIQSELIKINMSEIKNEMMVIEDDKDIINHRLFELYQLDRRQKLSDRTIKAYLGGVKQLLNVIDKPLTEIDSIDIDYFLRWYCTHNKNTGGKNQLSTVNSMRKFLSAFFTWMRKKQIITYNPCESIDPYPEVKKQVDYFSKAEMEQLKEACENKRELALIEFLRSTGARISEVVAADHSNIDWNTGDITIYMSKRRKYHTYFLDDVALMRIKEYLEEREDKSEALFVGKNMNHERLGTSGLSSIIKNIQDRGKIKCRVYAHKFRHTFGTWQIQAGTDIRLVSKMMGHASIETTDKHYCAQDINQMRYAHHKVA